MTSVSALGDALRNAGFGAAFPDVDVADLAVIDRGFGSMVVGIPRTVVIRIPRSKVVGAAHTLERALLPRITGHMPVAVPEVVWHADPSTDLPWGATAYPWIEGGQPVVPLTAEDPLVADLATFLATLHRIDASQVAGVHLPDRHELGRRRVEDVAFVEPVLRERLRPAEFSRVRDRLTGILDDPALADYDAVLRHGDLWFGNLLVDEQSGRLVAVLDWEHAAVGDPAEDLATQRYLGSPAAAAVVERYARLMGGIDPQARQRADHHFALREMNGIRRCIEMQDDEELDSELNGLRQGPLLA